MQARVLQERLQSKTPTPSNMEMTKAEVPTGHYKSQHYKLSGFENINIEIEFQHTIIYIVQTKILIGHASTGSQWQ